MTPDPLAALRDYHLPDPPGWWPPAPGWWVLIAVGLLAALLFAVWMRRRRRCLAAARQARAELAALDRQFALDRDSGVYLREISKLLRRYAIRAFPQHQVAALTGEDWLRFLDHHGGGKAFTAGPGRLLLDAPYRPAVDEGLDALVALVRAWVERNREVCP